MAETEKTTRTLILYDSLRDGKMICKKRFCEKHNIAERSFARDINDIRKAFPGRELHFDRPKGTYYFQNGKEGKATEAELLALAKIILNTRAFPKDEMTGLVTAAIDLAEEDKQKSIRQLLSSELAYYVEPSHKMPLIERIWDLAQCILREDFLQLKYKKAEGNIVNREVAPIAVVFSEVYFYLIAYLKDEEYSSPAFFRVDRIQSFKRTGGKYPYHLKSGYNVGEVKNSLCMMTGGSMKTVLLRCKNPLKEIIKDRFPSAEVLKEEENHFTVKLRVLGNSVSRWILSQGAQIEVLEPQEFRENLRNQIKEMLGVYEE